MATKKEKLQTRATELGIETEGLTTKQLKAAIAGASTAAADNVDEPEDASPELIALQEIALQLEVDIYEPGDDGQELTLDELAVAVDAKQTQLKDEDNQARVDADAARESAVQEKAATEAAAAAAQAKADEAAKSSTTTDASPHFGLGKPTAADRALAKKHGYPVAIRGAKAYRTSIRINCVYGGGLRQHGTIVLLTDKHAEHKKDYLKPVK